MKTVLIVLAILLMGVSPRPINIEGQTEITRWQHGKRSAVSITYDDGTINQFRNALPIMNRLKIPATFFIITGQIPGSKFKGKFTGRPIQAIIEETAGSPTDQDNFYERSSAAGYLGLRGTLAYHTRAGALYDAGKSEEAYVVIDDLYQKVRKGEFQPVGEDKGPSDPSRWITWEEIKGFAAQGHEFASHTVTHPYLCALDETNIIYELEKSREEIRSQLGEEYTFSAEIPYGTEHERAMEYAHKVYPALRNRMPEEFMAELNRASRANPSDFKKEYVQWQRGAVTKTTLPIMKSWIDTSVSKDNIWLVLVIHGVDGIGWEALPSEVLDEYFQYMKSKEDDIWIATFGDVTKYIRERMNTKVLSATEKGKFVITLEHALNQELYNLPLTLKTYVPRKWKSAVIKQGAENKSYPVLQDEQGKYLQYQAYPNAGIIEISRT